MARRRKLVDASVGQQAASPTISNAAANSIRFANGGRRVAGGQLGGNSSNITTATTTLCSSRPDDTDDNVKSDLHTGLGTTTSKGPPQPVVVASAAATANPVSSVRDKEVQVISVPSTSATRRLFDGQHKQGCSVPGGGGAAAAAADLTLILERRRRIVDHGADAAMSRLSSDTSCAATFHNTAKQQPQPQLQTSQTLQLLIWGDDDDDSVARAQQFRTTTTFASPNGSIKEQRALNNAQQQLQTSQTLRIGGDDTDSVARGGLCGPQFRTASAGPKGSIKEQRALNNAQQQLQTSQTLRIGGDDSDSMVRGDLSNQQFPTTSAGPKGIIKEQRKWLAANVGADETETPTVAPSSLNGKVGQPILEPTQRFQDEDDKTGDTTWGAAAAADAVTAGTPREAIRAETVQSSSSSSSRDESHATPAAATATVKQRPAMAKRTRVVDAATLDSASTGSSSASAARRTVSSKGHAATATAPASAPATIKQRPTAAKKTRVVRSSDAATADSVPCTGPHSSSASAARRTVSSKATTIRSRSVDPPAIMSARRCDARGEHRSTGTSDDSPPNKRNDPVYKSPVGPRVRQRSTIRYEDLDKEALPGAAAAADDSNQTMQSPTMKHSTHSSRKSSHGRTSETRKTSDSREKLCRGQRTTNMPDMGNNEKLPEPMASPVSSQHEKRSRRREKRPGVQRRSSDTQHVVRRRVQDQTLMISPHHSTTELQWVDLPSCDSSHNSATDISGKDVPEKRGQPQKLHRTSFSNDMQNVPKKPQQRPVSIDSPRNSATDTSGDDLPKKERQPKRTLNGDSRAASKSGENASSSRRTCRTSNDDVPHSPSTDDSGENLPMRQQSLRASSSEASRSSAVEDSGEKGIPRRRPRKSSIDDSVHSTISDTDESGAGPKRRHRRRKDFVGHAPTGFLGTEGNKQEGTGVISKGSDGLSFIDVLVEKSKELQKKTRTVVVDFDGHALFIQSAEKPRKLRMSSGCGNDSHAVCDNALDRPRRGQKTVPCSERKGRVSVDDLFTKPTRHPQKRRGSTGTIVGEFLGEESSAQLFFESFTDGDAEGSGTLPQKESAGNASEMIATRSRKAKESLRGSKSDHTVVSKDCGKMGTITTNQMEMIC